MTARKNGNGDPRAPRSKISVDLDGLELPDGPLEHASLASLLLHALTSGEGDPLEELLHTTAAEIGTLVTSASRSSDSPGLASSLYRLERSVKVMAEIRRRQVDADEERSAK